MSSKASKKAAAKARQALKLESAQASLQSSCHTTPAPSHPPSPPAFSLNTEEAVAANYAAVASQAFFQSDIIGSSGDDTPISSLFPLQPEDPSDDSSMDIATIISDILQVTGPLTSLQILLGAALPCFECIHNFQYTHPSDISIAKAHELLEYFCTSVGYPLVQPSPSVLPTSPPPALFSPPAMAMDNPPVHVGSMSWDSDPVQCVVHKVVAIKAAASIPPPAQAPVSYPAPIASWDLLPYKAIV